MCYLLKHIDFRIRNVWLGFSPSGQPVSTDTVNKTGTYTDQSGIPTKHDFPSALTQYL